jgi:hypothetical protein
MGARLDTRELAEIKRKLGNAGFMKRFPHPMLVIVGAVADEGLGFNTGVSHRDSFGNDDADDALEVVEVAKAAGNPYPERIAVGRARNCDVVLRDSSISKLHAHFRRSGARLELIDNDSKNGTWVNGTRLRPEKPTSLAVGDTIQFGSLNTHFLDAAELLRQL